MKQLLFILLLTGGGVGNSIAQGNSGNVHATKPFVLGHIDEIRSSVLNEKRVLNLYLPDVYDKDTAHYPVIYLLDGSAGEDFIHIVGLVQFFNLTGAMPKTIVVGIANVDRKRDFTFPTSIEKDKKAYPTTGGSARFIAFLGDELEPYIQKTYRTNGKKTLIGESLGGLLGAEILLKKPELFDRYILVSPSLWWDNESLLTKAPELLAKQASQNKDVYIAVGKEGEEMEGNAKKLSGILKSAQETDKNVHLVNMPDENHLTILHEAVYRAFDMGNTKK